MKFHLESVLSKFVVGWVLACLVLLALPAGPVFASSHGDSYSPADQRRLKRVEARCVLYKQQLTDSTKMLEQAAAVRPGFAAFLNQEISRGYKPVRLTKLLAAFDVQVEYAKTQRADGLAYLADPAGLTSNCQVVNLNIADTNSYRAMLNMRHIKNGFNRVYGQINAALNVYKAGVNPSAELPIIPASAVSVTN